jgi:hypothetical protein
MSGRSSPLHGARQQPHEMEQLTRAWARLGAAKGGQPEKRRRPRRTRRSLRPTQGEGLIEESRAQSLARRLPGQRCEPSHELCFTPTYASWANPIEAHFGPLRQFTLANSNHPQPHRADPGPPPLPALAQRQRPPSRRPRRSTQGTRPHPQRERHPLGRTPPRTRRLTRPALRSQRRTARPSIT